VPDAKHVEWIGMGLVWVLLALDLNLLAKLQATEANATGGGEAQIFVENQ
jgi:hypothetical protein